jgi:hypothetical protein
MKTWTAKEVAGYLRFTRHATPDQRFQFEERAAICEYDGNLPRDEAERMALAEVLPEMEVGA